MDEWCCVGVCDGGARGREGWWGVRLQGYTSQSRQPHTLAVSKCFVEVCISRSIWLVTARVSHLRISEHFVL